jgi:ribosome biogenesis GTPase / thiamine phosphate phosphatase
MHSSSSLTLEAPSLALLTAYGWDDWFAERWAVVAPAAAVPGRVLVEYRRIYDVVTPDGEVQVVPSGRLRQGAGESGPAVGDWVALRLAPERARGVIEAVLPRRAAFIRKSPDRDQSPQVIAANVDTVFIVDGLDHPPNLRRLERYLVVAWESGANPVVALSKADRCADVAGAVAAVESVAAGVPVLAYSAVTGEGLAALDAQLRPGRTVALLGPSGVGKSTLVNHFCGEAVQAVGAVREYDRKGRHTTVRRQLLRAPSGALVVDTPGMRELQLWEAADGLTLAFADVEALAAACHFSDCQHQSEPECAVLTAVEAGTLPPQRLESYHKLQHELAATQARRDPRARAQAARSVRTVMRAYNAAYKRRPGTKH